MEYILFFAYLPIQVIISKKEFWDYFPVLLEKSFDFIGLKNLGSTCYMNSVLQQLFMLPSFQQDVLNYNIPDISIDENSIMFEQFKIIFANLKYSNKNVF